MSFFTLSPNMSLTVPTVGLEAGPAWASDINACFLNIDGHDHTSGKGAPIPASALNINADLSMIGNNLTNIRSLRFSPQTSVSDPVDVGVLYEIANDLYYNDGLGNQIRITQAGSVTGASGTITGLPSGTASVVYDNVASTFIFQSATAIAANLDVGSISLRNTSPNSTYSLILQPPAGMIANTAMTLPTVPSIGTSAFLTINSSGVMSSSISTAGGITGSNIASATITGTNVTSNVNLPGDSVKAGSANVVTSAANATKGLQIVRGIVAGNSTIGGQTITSGEGFTASYLGGFQYRITFTTPFADIPAMSIMSSDFHNSTTQVVTLNASLCEFALNSSGFYTGPFMFIAIGQKA